MSRFVDRYTSDSRPPAVGSALRDMAVRALVPALALFAGIVAVGLVITGPLGGLPAEDEINRSIQAYRTATWDTITHWWSFVGNTEIIIGVCVVAVALLYWRLRQWWVAVIPALAISLQASVFVAATTITDRARPDVERLDPAPPTSSYPSGHTGAATALYLTFAMLAQRIEHRGPRRVVTAVCLVIPVLVGFARLYRGMHHLIDVVVGVLNGVVCAFLAWRYLRRAD